MKRKKKNLNSLLAYEEEFKKLSGRKLKIYGFMCQKLSPMTIREIKNEMYGVSAEMRKVQPRASDLIEEGWFVKVGDMKCATTGKQVCRVKALSVEQRIERDKEELRKSVEGMSGQTSMRIETEKYTKWRFRILDRGKKRSVTVMVRGELPTIDDVPEIDGLVCSVVGMDKIA
ncbi:MAG: hypothetical protein KAS32_15215 [Candidatus Peribacteraceae bacterium]|nr:hypothetical protein [Candidatus Peribacteraceae bacterium]